MRGLSGKRVLITGASSGIGRATAVAFAAAGATVIINHFNDLDGAEATKSLCISEVGDGRVSIIAGDVGSHADRAALLDHCRAEWGGLDVLVNNAAIKRVNDPVAYSEEDFGRVLAVNLQGPFHLTQLAVSQFREQGSGGVVVSVASVHDQRPLVSDIGYAMAKGGLAMMTKTFALAVARENIRINAVSPGAVDTPMNRVWQEKPETKQAFETHVPIGRAGQPEDIASAILFLAAEDSAYVTGTTLYVDGGFLL